MKKLTFVNTAAVVILVVFLMGGLNQNAPRHPLWEYKVVTNYELLTIESEDAPQREDPKGDDHAKSENEGNPVNPPALFGKSIANRLAKRIEKGLNKLGTEGWELVTVDEGAFYLRKKR